MARTYTVKVGDCLWTIAKNELKNPLLWTYIADINGISRSYPLIHPGDVLKLDEDGSSTPEAPNGNTNTVPVIQYFGLQAGTDRTVFAAWTWSRENTENYRVIWYYDTGQGFWFIGSDTTTEDTQNVYTAPDNAKQVKCKVQAISETHTVNDQEVSYWTCGWSTESTYDFSNNPPEEPSTPSVSIEGFTLTATLDNISDENTSQIEFQVVKDDTVIYSTGVANITTSSAAYSCSVEAGGSYKVRCRGKRDSIYGDWSDYSSNVKTIPATPTSITTCRANSKTSVYLAWPVVSTAETYEIEYATEIDDFDITSDITSIGSIGQNYYEVTGLESGDEYFFRVRAVNGQGESGWSSIASTVIGEPPAAPTTWSSTTTAIVGEPLILYWVHNSEDGSRQKYAEVAITVNGKETVHTINTTDQDEDEEESTYSYSINTTNYPEGTTIQWRVRTSGISNEYGDWSVTRTIDIYAPPTLNLSMLDSSGNPVTNLTKFPFKVTALAGPNTQVPIGYSLTITSNESYETTDEIGNFKMINAGEIVYTRYFDVDQSLSVEIGPSDVNLDNNISYTLTCVVSMDSGLTAEAAKEFTVSWSDEDYAPNAEVTYNKELYVCYIRPYCIDENNALVKDVVLSVYRREFDGSFVEIGSGIANNQITFITDPHPSLDYARYRVVAMSTVTGAISYYDLPGYPVQEKAVIIQWNEAWSNFDTTNEDSLSQPPWSGSLLRLPYNIDTSESNDLDVSLVEYIGRKHPVSYYGTQIGQKASWSMDVPKSDRETLYALRRLAIWTGDAYVREPYGTGYWAQITVTLSQTHKETVIPVSLEITRVEGGV